MGRFLIWLSGARGQILDECPTERPKYVGIGASILITATMAAVSLTFALVTALRVDLWLALPFAIAWGLAILSLDRLFVVSLSRDGKWPTQLLRATPRILLALLLGFVISTPFVLQIFRPEIEHEISILHTQAENAYLAGASNSHLQQQIKQDQDRVNHLTTMAGGGGPTPRSPQLQSTLAQLHQVQATENRDLRQWKCQLYGPCRPQGNGRLAKAAQQRYENDAAQVKQLTITANAEHQQLSRNIASAQAEHKAEAEVELPAARKTLQAAEKEQAQELRNFTTQNENNGGLLIRLRALDAITSHDPALNAARWLLFLLFVIIDCMPVMIKVMLNLGPENNYDHLLRAEEQRQRSAAASNMALRLASEMTAAVATISQEQNRLPGWTAPIPGLTQDTIAMRRRVEAARLEALEEAQIRLLGNDAGRHRQTAAAGPLEGAVGTPAAAPPPPPRRWWRRRYERSRAHNAAPAPGSLQSRNPGTPPAKAQPRWRRYGKSIVSGLDWFAKLGIPFVILAVTIWFTIYFTHSQNRLADQQHKNDIALSTQQHQDDVEQTYLGDMRDLLNQHLSSSKPDSKVRQVAIEDTVTTMRVLNAQGNGTVLRFLRDAGLMGPQGEVIDLSGANLSGAQLNGADLAGVALYGANLTGAHLRYATLTGTSLSDAILERADLTGARLGGAILTSADLKKARLNSAVLAGADLTGANITRRQIRQVNSCRDAALPTGFHCHRTPAISLTYWYTEGGQESRVITKTLIPRFEKLYPGIHINPRYRNFFDTRAAFTAAVQDRKAPDVLRADLSWTKLFASEGYLLNIDSYTYQGNQNLSDYRRLNPPFGPDRRPGGTRFSPLTYDEYNGHLYGLPQVTDILALLYNKKELAEAGIARPPHNMTQFRADTLRIVQQHKATYGFETDGSFNKAAPFLYACGGGLLDPRSNRILVNDRGSVSGLDFLLHLRKTGNVKPIYVNLTNRGSISPIVADFERGTVAMIFDGPYDVPGILTGSSFSHDHRNLGIADIPGGPGGQAGSPLGGQSYVISSDTAYPAEAYKFIAFMSSKKSQITMAKANHTLPTLKSVTSGLVSSNSYTRQFHRIWQTEAVARPAIPKAAYLFDVADPSIRAALTTGKQSAAQALSTAQKALNTIANAWDQLGAGTEIPQPALSPGASHTACS